MIAIAVGGISINFVNKLEKKNENNNHLSKSGRNRAVFLFIFILICLNFSIIFTGVNTPTTSR